jgi:hypothetical protein
MNKKLDIASNVLPVSVQYISKEKKELAKEKLKELIREETEVVRGIFQFFESPGGTATITIRKYPGVPMFIKTMKDGLMYEIPKYVARFLNGTDVSARAVDGHKDDSKFIGTCSYGVYDFKIDAGADLKTSTDLLPVAQISNFTRRYGFQSMDFGGAR